MTYEIIIEIITRFLLQIACVWIDISISHMLIKARYEKTIEDLQGYMNKRDFEINALIHHMEKLENNFDRSNHHMNNKIDKLMILDG
jgi:hypothetical protein